MHCALCIGASKDDSDVPDEILMSEFSAFSLDEMSCEMVSLFLSLKLLLSDLTVQLVTATSMFRMVFFVSGKY